MNDSETYILNSIKTWVWSGFYAPSEVHEMIDDILEDDADETMLRAAVSLEFEKKALAEKSWPETTDCDRLDEAFAQLNTRGIIALHNAGYTQSDGISDVSEVLNERGRSGVTGYCFYHEQDLERAVNRQGLMFAFGDLDDDAAAKTAVGQTVKSTLESHGFVVEWNGDPEKRIDIPNFDWRRRGPLE